MLSESAQSPDPRQAARGAAAPLPKRFYERAEVVSENGHYALRLDGKAARTPARHLLTLPTRALGEAVAAEWSAQRDIIDPATMPVTRLANSAIDGVTGQMDAVRDSVAAYAATDLLCYRAGEPAGLVARQNETWNPIIDWAEKRFGVRFALAEGVIFIQQPAEVVNAIVDAIGRFDDPFRLTGLQIATTLTGSVLIALATAEGFLDAEAAWVAGHVDEDWNISQWGLDDEAAVRRELRHADFRAAVLAMRRDAS